MNIEKSSRIVFFMTLNVQLSSTLSSKKKYFQKFSKKYLKYSTNEISFQLDSKYFWLCTVQTVMNFNPSEVLFENSKKYFSILNWKGKNARILFFYRIDKRAIKASYKDFEKYFLLCASSDSSKALETWFSLQSKDRSTLNSTLIDKF